MWTSGTSLITDLVYQCITSHGTVHSQVNIFTVTFWRGKKTKISYEMSHIVHCTWTLSWNVRLIVRIKQWTMNDSLMPLIKQTSTNSLTGIAPQCALFIFFVLLVSGEALSLNGLRWKYNSWRVSCDVINFTGGQLSSKSKVIRVN